MTRLVVGLGVLTLGSGCGAFMDFLGTKEGQQSAEGTGEGVLGVLSNPANPLAWAKLVASGAALAAGGLGLYHSPKAAKAVGKAAVAVKRRLARKKSEVPTA